MSGTRNVLLRNHKDSSGVQPKRKSKVKTILIDGYYCSLLYTLSVVSYFGTMPFHHLQLLFSLSKSLHRPDEIKRNVHRDTTHRAVATGPHTRACRKCAMTKPKDARMIPAQRFSVVEQVAAPSIEASLKQLWKHIITLPEQC